MKKRVLSLLLVVAMLASLVVFPAYAEASGTVLTADTVLQDGGSYYLEEDLIRDTLNVDGITVTIDLNGHVLRAPHGKRMLYATGVANVTIKDSSEAKTGEMQATGINGQRGGVIMLDAQKTATNAENPLTLNLEGGTIRQLYAADINVTMGGGIELETSTGSTNTETVVVNMTGGKITDGYVSTRGGNVCISGAGAASAFNMSGGKIVNGYAPNGGGFYLVTGSLNMTGGTCMNNIAASGNGGNIYNAKVLNITGGAVVSGGVASGFGGNIYNEGTATLNNVTGIDGDIYSTQNVTLKGTVKIPMGNSNGIMLAKSKVLTLTDVSADSEVFFGIKWADVSQNSETAVFTSAVTEELAAAYMTNECFKNVGRTITVTNNGTTLSAAESESYKAEQKSWCPHCDSKVSWFRFSAAYGNLDTYSHFFFNSEPEVTIGDNQTVVFDMCSQTVTNGKDRVFNMTGNNAKLAVLDTIGGGVVSGGGLTNKDTKSTHNNNGGVINVAGSSQKASVEILSGTLTTVANRPNINRGGIIGMNGGDVTIKGGILKNGYTTENGGGAIYLNNGTLNMTGGLITGGSTSVGGNIYVNSAGNVNITGGIIQNGTSTGSAGNIWLYGGASTTNTISDAIIRGGNAANEGGNIYDNSASTTTSFKNVTFAAGSADANGGNIAVCDGAATFDGCVIYDGTAKTNGGNILVSAKVDGTVTFKDCVVYNGKAHTEKDEMHERADNVYAEKAIELDSVWVYGNSGLNELGSGVYAKANVTLKNNTVVGSKDEAISGGLYLKEAASSLTVDESFSGTVVLSPYWLFVNKKTETVVAKMSGSGFEPYGQILDVATSGDFTANGGKLYMGDHKTSGKEIWSYGMPEILYNAEGLQVASGATLVNAEGTQFFAKPADAFTNYANGDVLKLVGNLAEGNHGTFNLKPETTYTIDLNGKMATVNGDATNTIYGLDSANAKNLKNLDGGLTVNGAVKVEKAATGADGKQYIALQDGDLYSFHFIDMDITKVTLRTSSAGIFYKGKWTCDAELAKFIDEENLEYGVVVSRENMPDENFATEESAMPNRYSTYSGNFVSGEEKTGAIVSGIFKEGNDAGKNTENADVVIYARAYLNLGDGKYIVDGEGAQLSMMNVLQKIDEAITADSDYTTQNQTQAAILMNDFYAKWADKGLTDAIANYAEKYEFVTIFQPEA